MAAEDVDAVVVLVPGLGLDARAWARVREQLPPDATVKLLPALGRPRHGPTDLRAQAQAGRLLAALPPGRRVVLVGHSASCPVVVEAAARAEQVVGLVLVGPVTDPRARTWPRMLGQWLRTAAHERLWELPVLAPQYRRTGVSAMVRGMNAVRGYRTDEGLARLAVPVQVIRGEHDRIAPADWCRVLAKSGSGAMTSVAGAAHMVPLTHPQVVADAALGLRHASVREGVQPPMSRGAPTTHSSSLDHD
jgi:pimeloyl-ACP methyl ester carboxylesterase